MQEGLALSILLPVSNINTIEHEIARLTKMRIIRLNNLLKSIVIFTTHPYSLNSDSVGGFIIPTPCWQDIIISTKLKEI